MGIGVRDASGNNPTHHLLDRPTLRSAPAVRFGDEITDADSVDHDFTSIARAIFIGSATANQTLEVVDANGNIEVFRELVAGSILDVQAIGTRNANSTVANIIPLF